MSTRAAAKKDGPKKLYAAHGYSDLEPTTIMLYRDRGANHLVGEHPLVAGEETRLDFIFFLQQRWVELEWID
jgi:hypothetical protein